MATTIATLTQKGENLEGTLTTLSVSAPIALIPNNRKMKDSEPDYRIISRKNGYELGAGWLRASKMSGEEYISVSLSAPEFGTFTAMSLRRLTTTRARRSSSGTQSTDTSTKTGLAERGRF